MQFKMRVWSTSTQYGPGLTNLIRDALRVRTMSTLSDADIIDAIQDVKRDKVRVNCTMGWFSSKT